MSEYNVLHLLEAILLNYPSDKFINDREIIHTAFSKVRQKHFELLHEITFRKNLLFPRSRILDELLSSLQPDFLGKINPTYDTYTIKKDKLKSIWDKDLVHHFRDKEAEIKTIANEFSEAIEDVNRQIPEGN